MRLPFSCYILPSRIKIIRDRSPYDRRVYRISRTNRDVTPKAPRVALIPLLLPLARRSSRNPKRDEITPRRQFVSGYSNFSDAATRISLAFVQPSCNLPPARRCESWFRSGTLVNKVPRVGDRRRRARGWLRKMLSVLFQCIGHLSQGHINPAVSIAAVVLGKKTIPEALVYILSQTIGAIVGYGMLKVGVTLYSYIRKLFSFLFHISRIFATGIHTFRPIFSYSFIFIATSLRRGDVKRCARAQGR